MNVTTASKNLLVRRASTIMSLSPPGTAGSMSAMRGKSMFGDQQMETLADIIQTALMLRYNERRVG